MEATRALLLAASCEVNARDETGKAALSYWSEHYDANFVTFLLRNGADSPVVDFEGNTPLHGFRCITEFRVIEL